MAEFIHKGKALLPMSVIRAAIEGDCEAIERVLRHISRNFFLAADKLQMAQ